MLGRTETALRRVVLLAALGFPLASSGAGHAAEVIRTHEIGGGAPPPGAITMAPDRTSPVELRRDDATPEPSTETLGYVPGRLIVKLDAELGNRARAGMRGAFAAFDLGELDALNRRYAARSMRRPFAERQARIAQRAARRNPRASRIPPGATAPNLEHVYVIELSRSLDVEAVAREYARVPGVLYAEPDREARTFLTTNDPYLTSTGAWGQPFRDLWGLQKLEAQAAWDVTRGGGITVAVIDTGIDASHPDIAARLWVNNGEVPDNGVDDDGNGYVDDRSGWNTATDEANVFDDVGHGTHVSGTIAATANNGIGIAGVAPEATIMPLKGFGSGGGGEYSDLAELILYAVDNGADVINASWGGTGESQFLDDAIATAYAAGVVFVTAAGNSAMDAGTVSPANNPMAITASAFDSTDTIAYFSNYGAAVDVAAPGGGDSVPSGKFDEYRSVLSLRAGGATNEMTGDGKLVIGSLYLRQAGTSIAAPHVSGAAALVLAHHPSFTVEQVRQVLRASADDVDAPGVDANAGYGRINVRKALAIDSALAVVIDTPPYEDVASRNSVEVTGTVDGPDLQSFTLEYGTDAYPTSWTPITSGSAAVVNDTIAVWDVSNVVDGVYTLRLRATTTLGASFEDRTTVTLDRVSITEPQAYTIHRGAGIALSLVGSAYVPGFASFTIEFREVPPSLTPGRWRTDGIVLAGGGASPVFEGTLATLDTSVLTVGRDVDFRVRANGSGATTSDTVYHVVIDPDLRPGWPRHVPGLPDGDERMQGQLTLADLDGNGTKEILLGYGELVFALNADGTDVEGWPQSVAEPDSPVYIRTDVAPPAADLDGDGTLEVVSGNGNSIYIWHHDGTLFDGWPKTMRFGEEAFTWGPPSGDFVLRDLDGDGARDIIFARGATVAALRTDGSYLPGWPAMISNIYTYLFPASFERAVAVGDITGDGRPEVVAVESHGAPYPQNLRVYDANGTELPNFSDRISRRHGLLPNFPVLADINGDGLLDIVANSGKVSELAARTGVGYPLRRLTRIPNFRLRWPGEGTFPSEQELLTAGDIDGDGVAEAVVATETQRVRKRCRGVNCSWTVLLGPLWGTNYIQVVNQERLGLPGWPVALEFTSGDDAHGPGSAAIGDIDGDGGQDLVFGTGMCHVEGNYEYHRCYGLEAFRADGTRLPGFPKPLPSPGATRAVMPAIGDLDGDGLKEIVFVDFNGNVLVWTVPGIPTPENMQWPMYRHDAAHTGSLH